MSRWNCRLSQSEITKEYYYYLTPPGPTEEPRKRPGLSKKDFERFADDAMRHFQMAEVQRAVNELTDENLCHKRSVPLFRRMWADAVFSLVADSKTNSILDKIQFLRMLESNGSPIDGRMMTESMMRILRVKHDAKITESQFQRWLLVVCDGMQDWVSMQHIVVRTSPTCIDYHSRCI